MLKSLKKVRIRKLKTLIASTFLVWSLLKSSKVSSLESSNQRQNTVMVHETVLKNELNNLEDSDTSDRIVETPLGTIFLISNGFIGFIKSLAG